MLKNDLKSKIQKSVSTNPKLYIKGTGGVRGLQNVFSDDEICCTSMWGNHRKSVQYPSETGQFFFLDLT